MKLNMEKDKKKIDQLVRKLQNTWLEHRVADLETYFHEDVVIFFPGSGERIEGRDAMIESYKQYLATSTTHNFQITNLHVDVFGLTAIAVLTFDVSYEHKEKNHDEKGNDIMILNKTDGHWKIVWRTQIPLQNTNG